MRSTIAAAGKVVVVAGYGDMEGYKGVTMEKAVPQADSFVTATLKSASYLCGFRRWLGVCTGLLHLNSINHSAPRAILCLKRGGPRQQRLCGSLRLWYRFSANCIHCHFWAFRPWFSAHALPSPHLSPNW
jgi:hypothetical protein